MNGLHKIFGYGGLVPFIGLVTIAQWQTSLWDIELKPVLNAYAALIYSFIGGIYWAGSLTQSTLTAKTNNLLLTLSIAMMLWAWSWLIFDNLPFYIMALSFWALPVFEAFWVKSIFASDFMKMRRNLSLVAGFCLISLHF